MPFRPYSRHTLKVRSYPLATMVASYSLFVPATLTMPVSSMCSSTISHLSPHSASMYTVPGVSLRHPMPQPGISASATSGRRALLQRISSAVALRGRLQRRALVRDEVQAAQGGVAQRALVDAVVAPVLAEANLVGGRVGEVDAAARVRLVRAVDGHQVAAEARDDPRGAAHVVVEPAHAVLERRDDLHRHAAVADDGHLLARQVDAVVPAGGVDERAAEGVTPGDVGEAWAVEVAVASDEDVALVGEALSWAGALVRWSFVFHLSTVNSPVTTFSRVTTHIFLSSCHRPSTIFVLQVVYFMQSYLTAMCLKYFHISSPPEQYCDQSGFGSNAHW
jgi:hypothetical protein